MSITEFTEKFHLFEQELFELQDYNKLYFWDLIRYYIFINVYDELTDTEVRVNYKVKRNYFKSFIGFLLFFFFIVKCKYIKYNKLNLLCSRSVRNGKPCDDILGGVVDKHSTNIETTRKRNIFSLNFFCYPLVDNTFKYDMKSFPIEHIEYIESKIKKEFNISIFIFPIVKYALSKFKNQKFFFDLLFKNTNIKNVNFVQNGIMKGLILSCEENDVKSVEYQHGFIGFTHPAYSYPNNINGRYYTPNQLSVFSSYWVENYAHHIPIIKVVGKYGVLKNKENICEYNNKLLFIGSDIHHGSLVGLIEYTIENSLLHVIYKLHPNQFYKTKDIISYFKHKYPDCNRLDIVTNNINTEDLISEINNIVVINSTVIYEGLQKGCNIYCYHVQDASSNENLACKKNFNFFYDYSDYGAILKTISTNEKFYRIGNNDFFEPLI